MELGKACLCRHVIPPVTLDAIAFDSPPFGLNREGAFDATRRVIAVLICAVGCHAQRRRPDDADRFLEIAKKLIQAINSDDSAAIQASFDAGMQQALPPEKATPFFRAIVSARGKLTKAGAPQVNGPTALVRISAERGAWDFKITLDASDKISGLMVTAPGPDSTAGAATGSTAVRRSRTPMQLPFRGEWFVFWGGDNEERQLPRLYGWPAPRRRSPDQRCRRPLSQRHRPPQRRLLCLRQGNPGRGPGTVVSAIDGVPDNEPGSMNPLLAVGNCLIIDHGSHEFAVYAHLKPDSLRVHRGDKVRGGQVLALCGNSGNSSEPHLHFHLQDKPTLQDGAGITPYFTKVKCRRGNATLTDAEYTFLQGDRIQSTTKR